MSDLAGQADRIEAEWYAAGPPRRGDRIVIDAPIPLLTMNAAKRTHHREWAKQTAAWREATAEKAEKLGIRPVVGKCGIDAQPYQFGGILADPGAHMPCVKACIDGLRDAGVLEDDTGEFVEWVLLRAPLKAVGAGLLLRVVRL